MGSERGGRGVWEGEAVGSERGSLGIWEERPWDLGGRVIIRVISQRSRLSNACSKPAPPPPTEHAQCAWQAQDSERLTIAYKKGYKVTW